MHKERRPQSDGRQQPHSGAKAGSKPGAKKGKGKQRAKKAPPGTEARRVAIEALVRIESGGAYANLVLPDILAASSLSEVDRRFVTHMVYGTTRMRRACDHLVDRFLLGEVEPTVRAALRLGAYQTAFLGTPPHAAVAATVGAVSGRGRSLVNAVLRKVATGDVTYPDIATELSYPDWIVEQLRTDIGVDNAMDALVAMNSPAETTVRDDGYIQDEASQLVTDLVDAQPGELVLDLCAAPGGKATAVAGSGATVIAADRRLSRARLTSKNIDRLGVSIPVMVADGARPATRDGVADKVLIDAPCSGLGSLRRRADARWRVDAEAPQRLADLQTRLVLAGLNLLKPGGVLTYSVCTLTKAEGVGVLERVQAESSASLVEPADSPWIADGPISLLVPEQYDGMMAFQLRV